MLLHVDSFVHRAYTLRIGIDAFSLLLLSLPLNLLLLSIVFGILSGFFVLDVLKLTFLLLQLSLNYRNVSLAGFVELRKVLESLGRHSIDLLAVNIHICLAGLKVQMELVDFVEARNLSPIIIDNIFLLFLNIVDRSLNLGCQILPKHSKIVLFLLFLDPFHGLILLFEDVNSLSFNLGFGATTEEERKMFGVDLPVVMVSKHASRKTAAMFGGFCSRINRLLPLQRQLVVEVRELLGSRNQIFACAPLLLGLI